MVQIWLEQFDKAEIIGLTNIRQVTTRSLNESKEFHFEITVHLIAIVNPPTSVMPHHVFVSITGVTNALINSH